MKIIVKSILLVLIAVFAGCGNEEGPENTTYEMAPFYLLHDAIANSSEMSFEKENLPEWLTEYIFSLKPDNGRDVAAFQAKWKGEDIYYVYDEYFSCLMCSTFHSNGEQFDWTENDPEKFWKSAKDWEIIYLSKSKIHDL